MKMRIFWTLLRLALSSSTLGTSPQEPLNSSLSDAEAFSHTNQKFHNHDPSSSPSNVSPKLVMYVQTLITTSNEPLSLLPLLEHETKVTHIILGSLHLHEDPGIIMFNNDPPDSKMYNQVWEEVKVLQEHGIKVLALLGGAAGATYGRLSGSDKEFSTYYRPLLALIKKYKLDGLDIDIEEEVDISVPLRLLKALREDLGSSFLLTMAPMASALSSKDGGNLSGFSYFDLDALATTPSPTDPDTIISLVSWYNAQFYGGFARSTWFYESIVKAGFPPNKVVISVVGSMALGENGFLRIEELQETVQGLRTLYGDDFGGVAGWEYFDAGSADVDGEWIGEPWRWVRAIGLALFAEI